MQCTYIYKGGKMKLWEISFEQISDIMPVFRYFSLFVNVNVFMCKKDWEKEIIKNLNKLSTCSLFLALSRFVSLHISTFLFSQYFSNNHFIFHSGHIKSVSERPHCSLLPLFPFLSPFLSLSFSIPLSLSLHLSVFQCLSPSRHTSASYCFHFSFPTSVCCLSNLYLRYYYRSLIVLLLFFQWPLVFLW